MESGNRPTGRERHLAGNVSTVVRVGDTVRRSTGPWTPAVHALLRYLEEVGFDGAPRVLGIDEQGREVLTYLSGDVPRRAGSSVGWIVGSGRDAAKEILGIPEPRTIRTAISLGYPDEGARRSTRPGQARKPLSEVVHEERYG